MWSNQNSQMLLVGMQHGVATMETSLAVSREVKYTLNHMTQQSPWVFALEK